MNSYLSVGALVHLAGLVAVSQLILSNNYHQDFYQNLNNNSTGIIHDTLDRFANALSAFLPVGGGLVGLGTLLLALVYLAATLYVLYLAR